MLTNRLDTKSIIKLDAPRLKHFKMESKSNYTRIKDEDLIDKLNAL